MRTQQKLLVAVGVVIVIVIAMVALKPGGRTGGGPRSGPGGGGGPAGAETVIVVGSKNFTEQLVLGEIMAQMMEAHNPVMCERKLNLGGTMICFGGVKGGDIDCYAEYTGTGLVNILEQEVMADPDKSYQVVKNAFKNKWDLVWLEPFGFNNTYTLTMRKAHAKELGIETISDLANYIKANPDSGLTAAFDGEFHARPDGYRGLCKHYGFEFPSKPRQMDAGLMYRACAEGQADVIDAFATDGRIPAYNLVVLEDDKGFFPPYYAAPLIRQDTLNEVPGLKKTLNRLAGKLPNETMQQLNYQVDEEEKKPADVARAFLEESGLLQP